MKPYYQHNGITLYCGDTREILPALQIQDGFCFTDPPYNVGMKYGDFSDALPDSEYLAFCEFWITEVRRLCPSVAVYAPRKYFLDYWQILGREFKQIVLTWPQAGAIRGGISSQFGSLLVNAKPQGYVTDHWHNCQRLGMGYFFKENSFGHPGYTSLDLSGRVLSSFAPAGCTVLDPFSGTGTTLRAAMDRNLPAVGIEQNEAYCEIACQRLCQQVLDWQEDGTE